MVNEQKHTWKTMCSGFLQANNTILFSPSGFYKNLKQYRQRAIKREQYYLSKLKKRTKTTYHDVILLIIHQIIKLWKNNSNDKTKERKTWLVLQIFCIQNLLNLFLSTFWFGLWFWCFVYISVYVWLCLCIILFEFMILYSWHLW